MVKELTTKEEILIIFEENWHDDDMSLLPPMFHGTDASLVEISKEERKKLYQAFETIFNRLVPLFIDNSITVDDKRLMNTRNSFGIDLPWTLEQVGNKLGVTRERIRQIEEKALRKLRAPKRRQLLEGFLTD